MAVTEQRPTKADATRARLRAAAVEAISRHGFHGTTTRDIASAAGLSTAALYVHYTSKAELLYSISRDAHEETWEVVRSAIESSDHPAEQLRRLVHGFVAYHAREHTKAIIISREMAALEPDHLAEIIVMRRRIESAVHDVLADGVARGVFDIDDARLTTISLLSLGLDVARWYRDSGDWTPEYVAERYGALALRIAGARID